MMLQFFVQYYIMRLLLYFFTKDIRYLKIVKITGPSVFDQKKVERFFFYFLRKGNFVARTSLVWHPLEI